MATLKDHQQAMVDLLASGSGIPASASRLAHAVHDVLSAMLGDKKESFAEEMTRLCNERIEATTPGLNDKALAADVEVCRPKQEIKESLLRAKERRVKELENTVRQLRASNAKLREKQTDVIGEVHKWSIDRCLAGRTNYTDMQNLIIDAYVSFEPEQAGCRKPDTQVCEHEWLQDISSSYAECRKCGDVQK
ncbi:hypothetical protein IDB12_002154 [Salmonella enterica subsp. enterica serovar Kentucky]|nr:hypothetical protein [Salmonella enterica subsp. enterica serovar Kentucky]